MTRGSVACAVLLACAAPALYAQGYVSKDKDGALVYSNKPPETVAASPLQMQTPAGADIVTYPVNGATLVDVQKDAALKGPLDPATGKRGWSTTSWSAVWNYWTRQEADSCRIDVVSVRMKIATQLPAWTVPKDAPATDQCRWLALDKQLRAKEEARAAGAVKRGRALERAILELPAHPRCETFAAEVEAMGKRLVDDGKPRSVAMPLAGPVLVAKPMSRAPAKPVLPPPPKPLAIPKSIYDACKT